MPRQTASASCLGKDRRFWKGLVRDAPAGIAPAAGRHHITNFDAGLARDAAFAIRAWWSLGQFLGLSYAPQGFGTALEAMHSTGSSRGLRGACETRAGNAVVRAGQRIHGSPGVGLLVLRRSERSTARPRGSTAFPARVSHAPR